MTHSMIPVAEIVPGIAIDFQGDKIADTGEHPEFEFEYQPVYEVVRETPSCVVLYCDNFACGFPPDHLVKCRRDTLPIDLYAKYPTV